MVQIKYWENNNLFPCSQKFNPNTAKVGCPRLVIQHDPKSFHIYYKYVFCGSY